MAWNPEVYDQFKEERSAPFFDLLKLVESKTGLSVIDLGCGTGELTSKLLDYLEDSKVLGIDSSEEMLEKAAHFATSRLHFDKRSIEEQLHLGDAYDLIISNAAIQWCSNHKELFPRIISKIKPGGQLAVQIPSNHEYIVHQLLRKIAGTEPYKTAYNSWEREYTVLKIEDYARILFDHNGREITVFEKVFPHVLENAEAVFTWASGTAMLPYIENLPDDLKEQFKKEYKNELQNTFPESPVFYPFKRTFISAKF
ncbi:trans-aconitate methyltransferase [Chryseobacterium lactis]|uniref:Methyltransferase domain-containing protein n=1 Tax=Chryseobacterium lactis TaxID=1241981 RepID=A0A3G6RKC1_CHRLC|nr:methyltransferase domain-containing protein [Chryseobacterium lactis]AZA83053.1 methyltransferase domain-containing protein [Chryseobacterium lactis]AZB03437.1 methyltransferase domain-containing protein [Chryseobacterium lactis]PNW12059.1 trans-aconitate methyltransferase [Chryseobacterium lactis]